MGRWLHALLVGLIGAGIVHIAILLLVPRFSERDAWSRLGERAGLYQVTPLDNASALAETAGVADPSMQSVACRFDLTQGVTHLFRQGKVPYWSASVYDRSGRNVYSLNDRSAREGQLDLVVLTPAQMVDIRKSPLPELENAVFVETPIEEGIVVVRGLAPDATWRRSVAGYLNGLQCVAQAI